MDGPIRIHVLPDLLVNKIAAGEVVERPASVAKELIENALDAGAGRVAVEIEEGGTQLIRVTDDGCGMSAAELRLAVLPHATSKITAEDDLYNIRTLGFRGEALASISSVAGLRIVSRQRGVDAAHELRVVAERIEQAKAAGAPPGTTVEVRDLFFNVPARRKFLKSAPTEVGHVHEQIARAALAHPGVGFEFKNNRRVSLNLPATAQRLERIARLYGDELAAAMLRVERDERGMMLDAYAAPPSMSRATPQWQYAFVNGRYIRDRFLQHAVKEAYRGLMEPNRHGVVFLFLTVDPQSVDVNVHPTKVEVRWADSGLIHSQVLSALRETFQRHELSPSLRPAAGRPAVDPVEQDRIRREVAEMFKGMVPTTGAATPAMPDGAVRTAWEASAGAPGMGPMGAGVGGSGVVGSGAAVWHSLYAPPAPRSVESGEPTATALPRFDEGNRPRTIQLHNLYLVSETEDGIVIVDQHALHERIMYEHLRARLTSGALESQRLLLPESVRVTPRQAALLDQNGGLLARLGIDVAPLGPDTVAVHAFPVLLKDADVPGFMRDLLDQLASAATTEPEILIHKVLDMMACKAAVKAGDPLSNQEINALMEQRHMVEKSSSCPHGRPTMLRFTKAELDRQFKRT